jgi:hypothetical protein
LPLPAAHWRESARISVCFIRRQELVASRAAKSQAQATAKVLRRFASQGAPVLGFGIPPDAILGSSP